jgi:putative ubiquitin-RnfH superfamily antitoxin RatB of RatAB toxin-antitoxin module
VELKPILPKPPVIPAKAGVQIEVVYAGRGQPLVLALEVEPGTTLAQAIDRSGVLDRCPEISLSKMGVGVFGRARGLDEPVAAGDRIEIYRPLPVDPKEARRRRAKT